MLHHLVCGKIIIRSLEVLNANTVATELNPKNCAPMASWKERQATPKAKNIQNKLWVQEAKGKGAKPGWPIQEPHTVTAAKKENEQNK